MVEPNKRPPVNKVETVHLQDFSGGLNSTISGSLLNINEAQVAKDMSLEQKGTIIPRNGRTKRYALPFSDSPVVGLGMLFKQDGTSHLIAASDDKLYSDAPRISEKWQHREDWELGAANQFVDYGREDGSLMLKAGNERVVSDWETAATAGTANSTYGYKFKTLKDVKLYKVFWTPKKLSSTYTITLWNNGGTGIWTNNVEIGAEDIDLIDTEQTIDFYTSPMLLEKDKEYTISIQCNLAEAVMEYTPATEPVVNGLVTHEGAFKKEGEYGFPDTAVAGKSFYNVDLGFELKDYVIDVQEKTSMDEGTYTNITYETPSEIEVYKDLDVDASSLEEYDHVKVKKESIIPCVEVRSLVGMTNANYNNADENHYPYIVEHDFDGYFPTGTTHWNDTQAPSDAEMVNMSRDSNNDFWQTDDPYASDTMAVEFRHYIQTPKVDLDNVEIALKVDSPYTGVDIDLYLCPVGGTVWGSGNTLIKVKSVTPVNGNGVDLSYSLTAQQITDCVNETTGELKFFVSQHVYDQPIRIFYNQVYVKDASVEEIDFSNLNIGYKVRYDDSNWSPEFTFSGDVADFSIHKYDNAVSSYVRFNSITSTLYELALEPKLLFCGKSGLTHERESASVQEDTTTGKSTGTLDNVEVVTDTDEVIQLTKQGIDKTDSVDLTLGTHTNTELDSGEVKLQVDPNSQGITPLPGYLNAKKFTIDHNVFDANEVDYPVMAKLYQDSNAPAWSSTGSYVEGDVVIHNNHYYKKSNTAGNAEPHVGTDWFLDWYWQGLNFDFTKIQADGKDIRFTASDGSTILDYERELWVSKQDYITSMWNDPTLRQSFYQNGLSETDIAKFIDVLNNIYSLEPNANNLPAYDNTFPYGGCKYLGDYWIPDGSYPHYHYKRTDSINGSQTQYSTDGIGREYDITFDPSTGNKIIVNDYDNWYFNANGTYYNTAKYSWDTNTISPTGYIIFPSSNWSGVWRIAYNNTQIEYQYMDFGGTNKTPLTVKSTISTLNSLPNLGIYSHLDDNRNEVDFGVRVGNKYWENINGSTNIIEVYNQAVFHVRIPSVSSSADTDYYMFYNNPDETVDGENKTGVWDSNFVMVQHMGSSLADSTSNGNDGTNNGSTVVDSLNGKGRDFDGSSDYIDTTLSYFSSGEFSLQALFLRKSSTNNYDSFIGSPESGSWGVQRLQIEDSFDDSIRFLAGTGSESTTEVFGTTQTSLNTYYLASGTHTSSLNKVYLNGVFENSKSSSSLDNGTGTYKIGQDGNGSGFLNGIIDEVRISNTARSDSWIKADDYNLRRWELYSNIKEVNFEEYYDTGSYETEVLDFSAVVEEITSEDILTINYTEPDDSTLTVYVRTSQDNVTWTAYSEVTTPTIPYAPYMQFRVDFTNSTDRFSTPTLSEITVGYKTAYHHSGTWESTVFDTLDVQHLDSIIHLFNTIPTGTGVTVEVAGSDDNVTFSAWATITDGDSLPVNRYLKFKVTLTPNSTLDVTPQHIGLKYFVSKLFKSDVGTYESPVYPIEDYLQETSLFELIDKLTSGDTSVSVEMARSYNNSVWEPYVPVTVDSELPQTDYYIKFKITTNVSTDKTKAPILDGFKVTLDNVELRPVWTSDVKNISESKDLGSGRLVFDYINSSGALAVLSRSSPNGTDTWSDWEHIDVDGYLMSPPNNYVQAKVIFVGLESELKELTLSMDGTPEAEVLASGLTTGATYSFTTLRDTLIIANGKDEMKKWDGLTATIETLGGGIAPMKIVTTHHNRVWGVDAENPSRVRYSNILDPETWGAFDFIDFNPEDGDYITAMIRYGQNLLISKKRSMALLTGNKTSNYNVSWLDSEAGVTGQYAITQGGKYICYVAQDGIRFTDLADSAVATERLIPHWDTINKRKLTRASMVYWRNKLFVSLPSEDSLTNNQVWVYDFLRNAWTINTGWEISNWLKFNQYGEDVLIGGSSEKGQTYVVDVTRYDDNDIIEYEWKSKDFNFDYAERYKLFRNIYLDLEGTPSESTLYVDLYVDGVLKGTYTTVIPAGNEAKHTRRVLPPLYNAVLGRMLTIGLRGRCGVQGITIEYVVRGAVPSGNL